MDYKAFAKAMRENAVTNEYGQIICSPQLWEQIATTIENINMNITNESVSDFDKFVNFLNSMNIKYNINDDGSKIKSIEIKDEYIYQSWGNRLEINFEKSENDKFIEFEVWGE